MQRYMLLVQIDRMVYSETAASEDIQAFSKTEAVSEA